MMKNMKTPTTPTNSTLADYVKDTKRAQRRLDWERKDRNRMYDDNLGVDAFCAEQGNQ
jgi:hypothetical protein